MNAVNELDNKNIADFGYLREGFQESLIAENDFGVLEHLKDLVDWHADDHVQFFQSVFSYGLCANFQAAAQEYLQGWISYTAHFGNDEHDYREHSFLKHPNEDIYFDALGFRSLHKILESYGAQSDFYFWCGEADSVSAYAVDEDILKEVARAFLEGVYHQPPIGFNH